jgi:hypothetical protein
MNTEPTSMLNAVIKTFNEELRLWENAYNLRANFGFRYNEAGRKEMYVIDFATAKEAPPAGMLDTVATLIGEACDIKVERIGEKTSDQDLE